MGVFLWLGLVAVASTPDAGAMAGSAVREAVASCPRPSVLEGADETTAEFVETRAGRAIRLDELHGPSGSGKFMTRRWWPILPGTCRTVALQMDCAGGKQTWPQWRAWFPVTPNVSQCSRFVNEPGIRRLGPGMARMTLHQS